MHYKLALTISQMGKVGYAHVVGIVSSLRRYLVMQTRLTMYALGGASPKRPKPQ